MTPQIDMRHDLAAYRRRLEDLDELKARRVFLERRRQRKAARNGFIVAVGAVLVLWISLFLWGVM